MNGLAFIAGFIGLVLTFGAGPFYMAEIRKIRKGPEFVPVWTLVTGSAFALGLTLIGVSIWLSQIL